MKAVHIKWVAAILLSLAAATSAAQDNRKSSLLDCGLRFGSGGDVEKGGNKYQPEKYRTDFQDVRPLPLQVDAEQNDFSLHVKSDSGERLLVEVITVARFECDLG
jgi:hypothetical protein